MMFIDVNVCESPQNVFFYYYYFLLLFVQKMSEVKCENYDCIKVMCILIRFTAESLHTAATSAANLKTENKSIFCHVF